jgi:hypothetical protein
MRTVKLVSKTNGVNLPSCHVASPNAIPGASADASKVVYEIQDVPDGISDERVAHIMSLTCDISWMGGQKLGNRPFKFSELGPGRIIR